MVEITRIHNVEVTCISYLESETKEEEAKRIKEAVKEATGADCVNVISTKEFIMEKE